MSRPAGGRVRRQREPEPRGLALGRHLLRERRFYDLALTLAKRVRPAWLFTLDHQKIMELAEEPEIPKQLLAIPVREVDADDEALLQAVRPVPGSYRENFDKGRKALVAFVRGEAVGYVWLWPKDEILYPRYAVRLALGAAATWGHFIYVHPKYRAFGIFPRLWQGAFAHARERGAERIFCMVDPSHRISMDAHTQVGWRPVADLVSLRLFGLRAHIARRAGTRWRFGLGLWRFS